MKKIKFFIFSLIFFISLSTPAMATLQDDINECKHHIEEIKQIYIELRNEATIKLENNVITQEEYNELIEIYNISEVEEIEEAEEMLILLEEELKAPQNVQKPDISINYDETGKEITDYNGYTQEEIAQLNTVRTLTFDVFIEDGTSLVDDFYIKMIVTASNFSYTQEIILDESNKYHASIYLPNDIYYVECQASSTVNSVTYVDKFVDISSSPVETIYASGFIKVDSGQQEIIKIEGNEYIEPEKPKTNYGKIIIIGLSSIAIIGIVVAAIIAIKRKRELEL